VKPVDEGLRRPTKALARSSSVRGFGAQLEHGLGMDSAATSEPIDAEVDDVPTVPEAARILRIGPNQVYNAIGRGEVSHRRVGVQ